MANVHGFNEFNNNRPNQGGNFGMREPMLGDNDLNQQIRANKIPFMNTLASDRPPLQQTIPYTLKLVWCPTLTLLTFTAFFLMAIWALYIVTMTSGIYDDPVNYSVLAPYPETLRKFGALDSVLIHEGQVWRFIAAAFLHRDILHIVMNSISLLFFVSRLEKCYNIPITLGLGLCSAITGNITSTIFLPSNSLSVGASTVIYGSFGGLIAYMIINWKTLGRMRSQLCCIIGIIIFISVIMSLNGAVDLAGHLGGLAGGLGYSLAVFPGIRQKNRYLTLGGSIFLIAYILVTTLVLFLVKK